MLLFYLSLDLLLFVPIPFQMLTIPENPYTWVQTSIRIKSTVVKLNIKDDHGNTIKIENLSEDIEITINDVKEPINTRPLRFYKQVDNTTLQYHTISHTEPGGSIRLSVQPTNSSDYFAAYVKYASRPTINDYKLKAIFPNFTSCKLDIHMKPVNCTEDPHQIFIPSEFLEKLGVYYIGIKFEDPPQDDNEHGKIRQRRDCEPGRRVKRSCIKYKDPPSPLPGNGAYEEFKRVFNQRTDRNYSLDSMNVGCSYWDESASTWTTEGCKVMITKHTLLACEISALLRLANSLL